MTRQKELLERLLAVPFLPESFVRACGQICPCVEGPTCGAPCDLPSRYSGRHEGDPPGSEMRVYWSADGEPRDFGMVNLPPAP